MSSGNTTGATSQGELGVTEQLVQNLDEEFQQELARFLLREIDEGCKAQLNSGEYDTSVSLANLYERFTEELSDDRFVDAVPVGISEDRAGRLVFQYLINDLADRNAILHVYDRQRVRSRVAEIARYFALIRQRFPDTDYEFAPSLSKMVKMDVQSRQKPKWGDEGRPINSIVRRTFADVKTAGPATEFEEAFDSVQDWQDACKRSLALLRDLCHTEGMSGLAKYQGRSIETLFHQAVTSENDGTASVVTATTGGGKTEAFLFPILGYALTAAQSSDDAANAILAYPRQDLCNDQFERLVGYLYDLDAIIDDSEDSPFAQQPLTVSLQHSGASKMTLECPDGGCDGQMGPGTDLDADFTCTENPEHSIDFARTGSYSSRADIYITTPDSLHRRLMDKHGRNHFWERDNPPKFVVLDEVHIYTNQYGMHVANVMRRLRSVLRNAGDGQKPVFVASSATISNAPEFTQDIFDAPAAQQLSPTDDELEDIGWEYLIFVKATESRTVQIPQGEDVYKPRSEWENPRETNVTDLATMIQVAFSFYHTMSKERPDASGESAKDKVLGFVDSIDTVKRLGEDIEDTETREILDGQQGLYLLRKPDAFLDDLPQTNPDCPSTRFREGAADHETAVCEPLPPNPHLNGCPVYEAGECWWTLRDDFLEPMDVYLHKSGRTERPDGTRVDDDQWDMMVTTSALEVGFDHPGIIGTFQYRAPMNIPGFVQRKGRGGRDPEDQPVSVVVLGSHPTDSFYFHHEELLSDPSEEYLKVTLDTGNEFVRVQHIVSAVFDYLSIEHPEDAQSIYYRLDMELLDEYLGQHRSDIEDWIETAFPNEEPSLVDEVLQDLDTYVEMTMLPIAPLEGLKDEGGMESFWEALQIERGTTIDEVEQQEDELRDLLSKFELLAKQRDDSGGESQ